MKNIRKLTAILLAAVMALTMLTACGGGSGSSRTEKERYVAGINNYLNKNVNGYDNNLQYDSSLDKNAKDYQETYEQLKRGGSTETKAKERARMVSRTDSADYEIISYDKLSISLSEQEKILLVANQIQKDMDNEYLTKYKWSVSYAWGTVNVQKQTVPIYIILHREGLKAEAKS